jgi:4-carboxymuconolactone decarboxylase
MNRFNDSCIRETGRPAQIELHTKEEIMLSKIVRSAVLFVSISGAAMSQERMPPIPAEKYTEDQKKAADEFLATRKVPVFGPFVPLIRSPEVMLRAKEMGDYLRYKNSIGQKLAEFTILIMARAWTADYEWYAHHSLALKAGLKPEIAEAIFEGRRPEGMAGDEEIVYDFVTELNNTKRISDRTYERAVKQVGEQGVIDIVGLQGYYTLIAMTLNVSRLELPKDGRRFPRIPD